MKNYAEKYMDAYKEMREAAIEKIKNYGKELDVYEEINKLIVKEQGYKSVDEITDDDRDDYYCEHFFNCVFEGKNNFLYDCRITKVRYNEKENDVDVFLEDDNYTLCEWFYHWNIFYGKDAIYLTVLEYID